MKVYELYKIGDNPTPYEIDTSSYRFDLSKRLAVSKACSKLKEGDGAFVFLRDSDNWRTSSYHDWIYAIVASTHMSSSPPYIIFQIKQDGSTKRFDAERLWDWVRQLSDNHPSKHYTGTNIWCTCIKTEKDDDGEEINLQSITAVPIFASRSFEELRLEDYSVGNKGKLSAPQTIDKNTPVGWGGYDINQFLEVDLGSEKIILRRPPDGNMYTQHQSLHIIKTTTVKSSKERKRLIDTLSLNCLVPSTSALYKLLQRDEKGKPVNNDSWGESITEQQSIDDMIYWYSRDTLHYVPYLPRPSKKRQPIMDASLSMGEHVRHDLMKERGWKGRIRLQLTKIKFQYLDSMYHDARLIDICNFIGGSDLVHGQPVNGRIPFVDNPNQTFKSRVCRLYFDNDSFPAPKELSEGGSNKTFDILRNYIRYIASREGSPVVCSSCGSKKDHYKVFACNKTYTNSNGQKKKCPFSFQVRWDHHGYYIHLLCTKYYLFNCGVSWHCCR